VNCTHARHRIEGNPLRELAPAHLEGIRSHAADCPSCAELLASVEALERDLGALPGFEMDPGLGERVMQGIAAEEPAPVMEPRTGPVLIAPVLRNLGLVVALLALLLGLQETSWQGGLLSLELGFRLDWLWALQSLSMAAVLSALACLLYLAGFSFGEE